jgi:hypothetical protein
MSILLKVRHSQCNSIKNSHSLLKKIGKLILKCIQKYKEHGIGKSILKNRRSYANSKFFQKVSIIKTVLIGIHTQTNGTASESRNRSTHIYPQLIFDKVAKASQ